MPTWELDGRWTFLEATTGLEDKAPVVGGHFDLTVLLNRITDAVERTGAQRVAIDSLNVLFARFEDSAAVRDGLVRITSRLERLGVTALMTIAREEEADHAIPMGVEEYVADNLVILRNELEEETRRRTIEVLKLRGTRHRQGDFPFAITREHGLVVIPLSVQLDQPSARGRITSGIPALDEVRRRTVPGRDHPRLRVHRHRQDLGRHAVRARRRTAWRTRARHRLRREP